MEWPAHLPLEGSRGVSIIIYYIFILFYFIFNFILFYYFFFVFNLILFFNLI